jgi:enediyne biosynthesis protein E4
VKVILPQNRVDLLQRQVTHLTCRVLARHRIALVAPLRRKREMRVGSFFPSSLERGDRCAAAVGEVTWLFHSILFITFMAFANPAFADTFPSTPHFLEETQSAGITSIYQGDWDFMAGGGVATFDCNADGFSDMVLAGGTAPAQFYRNTSTKGGALHFARQTSGLELDRVTGAYPLDIDSDGLTDIVLLRSGENKLMRGLGRCLFKEVNADWGFDGGDGWSTAFAATWEKGNTWPTLAIGNYIDRTQEDSPWGSCTDNELHRPDAIQQRFEKPLPLTPSYCALSMLFTDWNRSGTASLRVANDREYYEGGQEQMWRIEPGKPPDLYTEADGWQRLRIWGMGLAGYDLDGDGYPEYAITSMADNKVQKLAGPASRPVYKDIAWKLGATAHRPFQGDDLKPSTAWHVQFEDLNNDGLADLFIAKGNVDRMPDFALKDPNDLLVQQPDGTFREVAAEAGIASTRSARGAAITDFNRDGLLDLIVVNRRETAQLWRNVSADAGHWIEVQPRQKGANRVAIGGWIEIRQGGKIMRRELTAGGGHVSGQLGPLHFGLDQQLATEARIIWPDGVPTDWARLPAGRGYVWERGELPFPIGDGAVLP